jgi:hypothetical protein
VGAPGARAGVARRLHPARRGDRARRAPGPVGAARGGAAGRRVARRVRRRRVGGVRDGERGGAAAARRRVRRRRAPRPRRRRAPAGLPAARDHRVGPGARHGGDARPPRRAQGAGRAAGGRRLRHRLLVAQLPAALPHRRAQDRQELRRRAAPRRQRRGARPHHRRPRRLARAADGGRGRGERRTGRGAPRDGVPVGAGGSCSRGRWRPRRWPSGSGRPGMRPRRWRR